MAEARDRANPCPTGTLGKALGEVRKSHCSATLVALHATMAVPIDQDELDLSQRTEKESFTQRGASGSAGVQR